MTKPRWLPGILRPSLLLLAGQSVAVLVYLAVERQRGRGGEDEPLRVEQLEPRRAAPDLTLIRHDGSSVRLSELRGRTVLLHFWATWCPPCRDELPRLLALGRDSGRNGDLEVLAIALDADPKDVGAFFEGRVPREVVLDPGGHARGTYAISALPDTYVVASDGALAFRLGGSRNWSGRSARQWAEALRGGRPSTGSPRERQWPP